MAALIVPAFRVEQVCQHTAHYALIVRDACDMEEIVLLPGLAPRFLVMFDNARNAAQQPDGVSFQCLFHKKLLYAKYFFTKNTQQDKGRKPGCGFL
jgi:hypothetical protein